MGICHFELDALIKQIGKIERKDFDSPKHLKLLRRLDNLEKEHQKSVPPKKWAKRINQFTLDGVKVNSYPSVAEAARELGLKKSQAARIMECCHGMIQTRFGFRWEFAD